VLGPDAVWRSIQDKATGKEYCPRGKRIPFAAARVGDKTRQANSASLKGDKLTIGFEGCDTRLTYAVTGAPDWIVLRLAGVEGARPSHLTLVRIGVTLTEHVGRRLNCGWDDHYAICLTAVNLQTQGGARRRGGYAELAATTQDAPGPKLEGAAAALVGAPTAALDAILRRLSVAYGLPRNEGDGVPSKRLPIARQSYWFLSFGEKDVDRVIDYCRRSGFRQVMMGSGSWCRTVGHYTFRTDRYSDGIESLRRTVERLHQHGILVGMHCYASKISKTDPYVTPVPDRRFWVDMTATLPSDIGSADTAIRTSSNLSQWPGSPACKRKIWEGGDRRHQEVIIGDEIVRYKSIGPEGRWDTFVGCERGAWRTRAAGHKAGALCRHYGVDGCINGYIIDQETGLLDETTSRLAHIFNYCGCDMVYFDGGEDVDRRRFTHYVSKFQAVAMSKFKKRPLIHMGTIMTHNLWHSFTRSATVDTYLNTVRGRIIAGGKWEKLPTVKDHIDRSVRYMLSVADDRMPGELGWFGIWPRGKNTDGLQFDEVEYLMCKSLAYDAPISLQTSFASMEAHPLTPGILEIVKAYEALRLSGKVPEATRQRLREKGKDFVLLHDGFGSEFVGVQQLPAVAGRDDLRAFAGELDGGSVVTLWHREGREGKLVLEAESATLRGLDGWKRLGLGSREVTGGPPPSRPELVVNIGGRRTTLEFVRIPLQALRKRLREARFEPRSPTRFWLQAENAGRIVGRMARGSAVGVREPGAFGDVILCTDRPNRLKPSDWYCEYRVQIPHKGRWTLWARVRYPSGADHSFGIVLPGEKVTLSGKQVLGNCGVNEKKWHWTGRGGGTTTVPPGRPITFTLPRGRFTFRIYPREGGGTTALNPRLDCLCLTDDPAYVPTDAEARNALEKKD